MVIGITEQPDPPSYDQRFYWGVDNPKQLEDIGPDANTGITTTGLKTLWKNQQDETAHNLLSESDWYVTRKSEKILQSLLVLHLIEILLELFVRAEKLLSQEHQTLMPLLVL